jgi:hypothetical protein
MAGSKMASAATALEPMKKRGRPTGSGCIMTKPVDFDIEDAVDALSDIACQPPQGPWNWDGSTYPLCLSESMSPVSMECLDDHSPVLFVLFRLAPNGDPNMLRLRDLLMQLHDVFGIFPEDETDKAKLWFSTRAALAAEQWRVMCKHCLMLVKNNGYIYADR